jgi:hypothetical protein
MNSPWALPYAHAFIETSDAAPSKQRVFLDQDSAEFSQGKFHDQGDAWIVIKGQLRRHNDTPFGRPTPGRHLGRPGVGGGNII